MDSFDLKFEEANRFVDEMIRTNGIPYLHLKFQIAIRFFAEKLRLTAHEFECLESDVMEGAFLFAGRTQTGQPTSMQLAVKEALCGSPQKTLREFSKVLRQIAAENGREMTGLDAEGWRARIIYDTNLRTAYMAGRWQQLMDSGLPYLQYHCPQWRPFLTIEHECEGDLLENDEQEDGACDTTRRQCCDEHCCWDGLVLRADDPWWVTHYPPNGFGCQCSVTGESEYGVMRAGGPDAAPSDGTCEWLDKAIGLRVEVRKGIDPGWDYNIGNSWLGRQL